MNNQAGKKSVNIAEKVNELFRPRDPNKLSVRPPFPRVALIELANVCNHKCVFCPIEKMTRSSRHIPVELLQRVLREAFELGTREVGLYSSSEPFASKHLEHFIKLSKDIGYQYIYTTTNGSIPSHERMIRAIDAGLDSIKFSVNGGDPQSYLAVHGKDHFDRVIDNIKFLYHHRKEHSLSFYLAATFVECNENKGTFPKLEAILKPYVDELLCLPVKNVSGQMYGLPDSGTSAPCFLPFETLDISSEGYVRACANDYQNYLAIEDLNGGMSLEEAYYSDRFTQLRQRHLDNRLEGTLCYNCINSTIEPVEPLNRELYTKVPIEFNMVGWKKPEKPR